MLLPTGPDGLRRFTRESLAALERRIAEEQAKKAKGGHSTHKNTDPLRARADLEAGKQLPRIYGDVPPELIGIPLEDIDPFYYKNQRVRSGRSCVSVAPYCLNALYRRSCGSAEAVTISGLLAATGAERLHHFRSLDSEIGLVSFDLQSRSGCCPLTVCLWRDENTDVAVILRVSLFWHVIRCWMGGLSQDRK